MKNFILLACISICCYLSSGTVALAGELTAGRNFYIGIPHCKKPINEGARGVPLQLWIASKTSTKVYIEAAAIGLSKNVSIRPDEIKIVDIPEGLMNTQSEIARPYGIHLVSEEPITVTCYMSYKATGESFAVIPNEYLGKDYYTLNLWQDATDEYKPGQILIVGTESNTMVTYTPTVPTDSVAAGKSKSIVLQQGETFLIQSKRQDDYNQNAKTDLSGTHITSNKPIAVLSGHTKGAFPRFSGTMMGVPANFMRNMLIEQLLPVSLLDTMYVSAPFAYNQRPYNDIDKDGEGDFIRFIATQDNTTLYTNRTDGSRRVIKQNMKQGEVYDITTQKSPALYTSSKPVLVGQYAKAWRLTVVPPIVAPTGNKTEQPANPSRSGEGMLCTLIPHSAWTSSAIFRSSDGMNNFVGITFLTSQVDSLSFNKRKFRTAFGSKIQEIIGSPYSYVAASISPGINRIDADSGAVNVTFAAYVYGNYDAIKDGFAYGYPAGVNYALKMQPDSLSISYSGHCTTMGKIRIVHNNTPTYAGFFSVVLHPSSTNYGLSLSTPLPNGLDTVGFTLTVTDPTQDAIAVMEITDKTGHVTTKTFSYTPAKVTTTSFHLNLGVLQMGQSTCSTITVKNPLDKEILITNLGFRSGNSGFALSPPFTPPLTLPAGSSVVIPFCATAITAGIIIDSLEVEFECRTQIVARMQFMAGQPVVTMTDIDFGVVAVGAQSSKQVTITNISQGNLPVVLDTVSWHNKNNFSTVGLMDKFPIVLPEQGSTFTFTVLFTPSEEMMNYQDQAQFTGNTNETKTFSSWIGRTQTSTYVPDTEKYSASILSVSPQPASDGATLRYRLETPGEVTLSLYNLLGERIAMLYNGMQDAGLHDIPADTRSLPVGVYFCRLEVGTYTTIKTLHVLR